MNKDLAVVFPLLPDIVDVALDERLHLLCVYKVHGLELQPHLVVVWVRLREQPPLAVVRGDVGPITQVGERELRFFGDFSQRTRRQNVGHPCAKSLTVIRNRNSGSEAESEVLQRHDLDSIHHHAHSLSALNGLAE